MQWVVGCRNMFAKQPRAFPPMRRSGSGRTCPKSWSGSATRSSSWFGMSAKCMVEPTYFLVLGGERVTISCAVNRTGFSFGAAVNHVNRLKCVSILSKWQTNVKRFKQNTQNPLGELIFFVIYHLCCKLGHKQKKRIKTNAFIQGSSLGLGIWPLVGTCKLIYFIIQDGLSSSKIDEDP